MPTQANQYSTETMLQSTSGTATLGIDFGFKSNAVYVYNDKSVPVYVNFASSAGTTAGHRTCATEAAVFTVAAQTMGLASTTTSTAAQVRVTAFGGY